MSMCKVLCVTNRHLVQGDFLTQLEEIAEAKVDGVILREKDMSEADYRYLAREAAAACKSRGVLLLAHTYVETALELGISGIHLSFSRFLQMSEADRQQFLTIGVSTHSLREAAQAMEEGASYVTAGHVFVTDCKKGMPPRGFGFLQEVCARVPLPVYAIGGITPENAADCMRAGAAGVCLMSSLMQAEEPGELVRSFQAITI